MFATKNVKTLKIALAVYISLTQGACADSIAHSHAASQASGQALAHSGMAAVGSVATIAAIPLLTVGAVGQAVGMSGQALIHNFNQPLPLGNEIIIQGNRGTQEP